MEYPYQLDGITLYVITKVIRPRSPIPNNENKNKKSKFNNYYSCIEKNYITKHHFKRQRNL